jgi:hypothetical protein
MRTLIAFILGVVVTVGAAYVHDTTVALPTEKPLVNWDQFNTVAHNAIEGIRNQWNKMTK